MSFLNRVQGKRIAIIGDSIAAGRNNSTGVGSTPTAGTVKQWSGTAWIDVEDTDVVTATAFNGSPWPRMGIDLNAFFGETIYLIPCGVSSSMFYTNAGYTTWQKGDTNYTAFQTKVTNGLADCPDQGPLDAIVMILGINDIVVSSTLANVETAIEDLFADLVADYPGVPIIVAQPGRKATGTATTNFNDARFYAVRYKINEAAHTYADVHIGPSLAALVPAAGYSTDDLHPNLTGDEYLGQQFARWFKNSSYSKWARSVISCMFDELSTLRKGLIADFIESQIASGNFDLFEQLGFWTTSDQKNCYIDISLMGGFYGRASGTYVANSHIATNGTDQWWTPTFINSINNRRSGTDDFIEGYFLKDNVAAAATSIMAGNANASQARWMGQTSGVGLRFLCNDLTANTYASETAFTDDAIYSYARNGTSKYLYKEATQVHTVTQASIAPTALFGFIGARNNNGTADFHFSGQWRAHFVAKHTGFDLSDFVTEIRYLAAHWND